VWSQINSKIIYRKEIDGLRAVAGISVVVFHSGWNMLPGGFLGVDVFFVISGYLFTILIIQDIKEERFSVLDFFERRARRILPASLLVIAVAVVFFQFLALPGQANNGARSAVPAVFSASNCLFIRQSGYFALAGEFMPLLHTWSLAVEEQFYLEFAVLALLSVRFRLRLILLISFFVPFSFLLSFWFTYSKPSIAYFMMPTRAWEMGLGALAAFGFPPAIRSRFYADVSVGVGLTVLLCAFLLVNTSLPFPGWIALFPCHATAMILIGGEESLVAAKLLGTAPMVFIGKISFSVYLWHWVVFSSFLTYFGTAHISNTAILFAIISIFIISLAIWKFFEQPFRNRQRTPWPLFVCFVLGLVLTTLAVSIASIATGGFPNRLDPEVTELLKASVSAGRNLPKSAG
jgi:peptidoglycan/LPS O-acetylase OafA/YrhL